MTYYNSNAPRIISNGGGSRAKIHIDENTTFVTDVETSDRISTEKNGRLTYKIVGGIDRHLFEIDKKTGVLSFKNAPDFEHPTDSNRDGDYHVKVKVIDGAGYTDTQKIEVVVKDVDETPVVFDPNKIDFEADANGNRLETGQIIDNEFSGAGFTVRSSNSRKPAMIFDTANPTGDDHDLGRFPELSKVLIISEDGDSRDPDDNAGGGTLIFDFDDPRFVGDIGLLDTEEGGSIRAYDSNGNLLSTTDIPSIRNGARQDVGVDTGNVSRLEVHLDGSGAIAHLCIEEDINEAPHANDDSASVDAGEMVVIDVLGNDTDPDGDDLTIDNVGNPDNGTV
ncbi:MAG: Ig-like domain-containing protein, partial [Microcoleaceae cyanobacterium]